MADRFLVTGAAGCIGSWTVGKLMAAGTDVVTFDVSEDLHRLRLVLDDGQLAELTRRTGDIRDLDALTALVDGERITHIVHLAALQVPFCKADPVLGSEVNVTGTVNVLEAARRSEGRVRGVSYASSVAVFGPAHMYPGGTVDDESPLAPETLYGAYKQANEWTARVYAADWGVGSVGLRPSVVYGPGRDQGLTSDPTKAMLRIAAGQPAHIAFGGAMTFHHASDVADYFIASARLEIDEARVHNIGGPVATIEDVVGHIGAAEPGAEVSFDDTTELPIPVEVVGDALDGELGAAIAQKPLAAGIAETIERFRELLDRGLVEPG